MKCGWAGLSTSAVEASALRRHGEWQTKLKKCLFISITYQQTFTLNYIWGSTMLIFFSSWQNLCCCCCVAWWSFNFLCSAASESRQTEERATWSWKHMHTCSSQQKQNIKFRERGWMSPWLQTMCVRVYTHISYLILSS